MYRDGRGSPLVVRNLGFVIFYLKEKDVQEKWPHYLEFPFDLKGNMSCWSLVPEDLKREISRFLHKKYLDVVMVELVSSTECISFYGYNQYETKLAVVCYCYVPRWVWIYPDFYNKLNTHNILFERKRCSGKMQSLP